jgi:recombination protein RecR
MLFVLEKDVDVENVERSNYRGVYFVLGGAIPLGAEEPEKHIRIPELLKRAQAEASEGTLKEIILGLSATTEGDHTRDILAEKLRTLAEVHAIKISALGRGLSTGSELEYADPDTISNALSSRS